MQHNELMIMISIMMCAGAGNLRMATPLRNLLKHTDTLSLTASKSNNNFRVAKY